jgi:hypothetical protein
MMFWKSISLQISKNPFFEKFIHLFETIIFEKIDLLKFAIKIEGERLLKEKELYQSIHFEWVHSSEQSTRNGSETAILGY